MDTKIEENQKAIDSDTVKARKSLILLVIIFIFSLLGLVYIYAMFPELDE